MATQITRGQEATPDINLTKPVFVKARHLPEEDNRYTVNKTCWACEDVAGYKSMDGAQRIGGLWRLYSYCLSTFTAGRHQPFGGCMSPCWTPTLSWSWVTMVRKSLLPGWLCRTFLCPTTMLTLRQHWKNLAVSWRHPSAMSVIQWETNKMENRLMFSVYWSTKGTLAQGGKNWPLHSQALPPWAG